MKREGVTESALVSHRSICQCARTWLCIFIALLLIIVIIYHYSSRERKIVSTDDMGAVCRGLLQHVGWRNASLQDVGLICPNENAHT